MRKFGANQYQANWKLNKGVKSSIITVIAIMFFGLWIIEKTKPPVISPLSDSPIVSTVYASEVKVDSVGFLHALAGRNAHVLGAIARCESGFWPEAVNTKTGDYGIFQINLASHRNRIPGTTDAQKIGWLKNPINNILFAYMLFTEQGLSPWYSSINCWGK